MQDMVSKSYHIFITYISVLEPGRDAIIDDAIHGKQVISDIYHIDQLLSLTEMPSLIVQYMVSESYHLFITYRSVLEPDIDAIIDRCSAW